MWFLVILWRWFLFFVSFFFCNFFVSFFVARYRTVVNLWLFSYFIIGPCKVEKLIVHSTVFMKTVDFKYLFARQLRWRKLDITLFGELFFGNFLISFFVARYLTVSLRGPVLAHYDEADRPSLMGWGGMGWVVKSVL